MNCPQCKRGDVVERRNKKTGQSFYGCSRYPDCKFAVADLSRLAPSALKGAPIAVEAPVTLATAELVSVLRELTLAIASLADNFGASTRFRAQEEPEPRVESDFSSPISEGPRP